MEIKNAKISSTMLGREDHGIMTFMIYIDTCDFDCCIGRYCLDEFNPATQTRVFRSEPMGVLSKILEVVGVDKWEDLPGKYIRFEDNGFGSNVTKIGNIIDEKWLDFREFFGKVG